MLFQRSLLCLTIGAALPFSVSAATSAAEKTVAESDEAVEFNEQFLLNSSANIDISRYAYGNPVLAGTYRVKVNLKEVAIKWSAAPDMTPQTVLYRRPVAQFSNFQPKIVSSWLILALFQANFLISGRSRLCPYQLVNSNQVRQGE